MRCVKSTARLCDQMGRQSVVDAPLRELTDEARERNAVQPFHGDEHHVALLSKLENLTDVRVIDRRGHVRLVEQELLDLAQVLQCHGNGRFDRDQLWQTEAPRLTCSPYLTHAAACNRTQ